MSELNDFKCEFEEGGPTFRPGELPQVWPIKTSAKKTKTQKSYRKKVESEWSQKQILKLISEIETRRSLWDAGCSEYKQPKEAVWQEVADALQMTLNDCKGKWSNLRITFNSNLDKYRKKKSGQGACESVSIAWKYFKPMLFLETKKVPPSTKSTSSLTLNSAIDERNTQEFVSPSTFTSGQRRKRRITTSTASPSPSDTSGNSSLKQMTVEALQYIRSSAPQPKNASTALCDYMASELLNLMPEQARYARSKLRRAFNDIMDEAVLIPSSWKEQAQQQPFEHYELPTQTATSNRNNVDRGETGSERRPSLY